MRRFVVLLVAVCLSGGGCRRASTDGDVQEKSGAEAEQARAAVGRVEPGDFVVVYCVDQRRWAGRLAAEGAVILGKYCVLRW